MIQLALYLYLAAITATRPGALVSDSDYDQPLQYWEMELSLERNGDIRTPILFILFHSRKGRKNREKVKFALRDIGDDPTLWPVALVIALAFHDGAFRSAKITTPADLTSLEVCIYNIYILH